MTKTIFKNGYLDALFLFFPIVFSILLAETLTYFNRQHYLLIGIVFANIVDSGHVYITAWRTWLHTGLIEKPKQFFYYPLIIFVVAFFWSYTETRGLWAFVIYFTIYHNIRQLYGISKWYQVSAQKISQVRDFFLYFFCAISFLAFHFRTNIKYQYYSSEDLFLYPDIKIFKLCLALLATAAVAWVCFEVYNYFKTKQIETGSLLFSISGCIIYMYSFLFSKNELQLMAPLVVTHGLHYYFLTLYACVKTPTVFYQNIKKARAVLFLTMVFIGAGIFYFENSIYDFHNRKGFWASSIVALYLVPLISHFLFDAIIWKKNYPEFKTVTTKDSIL